jgi:hypothetical protein
MMAKEPIMKKIRLHLAIMLVVLLGINTAVVAAEIEELFRENSVLSDKECDDATTSAGRIFFYIRMIKESYNNICELEKINCANNAPSVTDLVASITQLEKDALSFELDIIKKTCVASKTDRK